MFIDIHQHLIYGVDDGAKTFADTQRMILAAQKDHVGTIFATSHAQPGRRQFPLEDYYARLQRTQEWCQESGIPIQIYPGAEIMYSDAAVRMLDQNAIPTLANSQYVLVEFLPSDPYKRLCQAARQLGNAGYMPIFAHVERYACLRHIDQVRRLREEYQVQMQMNARTLLEKQGLLGHFWIRKMINEGYIDYIASDSHNLTYRKTCLSACRKKARESFDDDLLEELMSLNAEEIIQDGQL